MMGAHLTKSNLVRGERRKGHHYAGDVRTLYRVYNYRTNMNVAAKCPLKWKRRGGGQERHDIFMGGNGSDGKRGGGRKKKGEGPVEERGTHFILPSLLLSHSPPPFLSPSYLQSAARGKLHSPFPLTARRHTTTPFPPPSPLL